MTVKRKVCQRILSNGTGYKVYRLPLTLEWATEFYAHGRKHDGATYYTDERADAVDTGEFYLNGHADRSESVTLES